MWGHVLAGVPLPSVDVSVGVVQRHHVRSWSDRADARFGLAELVLRLVKEPCDELAEVEFATDEGVDLATGTCKGASG